MSQNKESSNDGRELSISRLLNAPIELVWEVWTNPEHIKNWWGPTGFNNTIHQMDLKEGGEWKLTMHGPDGTNYPNRSIFKEIVPLKKIVFEHFNPHFITTIIFETRGGKTFIDWTAIFDTAEMLETVVKAHNAKEGQKQNIERLENYLKKMNTAFTIERIYNAPVSVVWKALTDKDEMKKWYFDLAEFKAEPGFEFQFYGQGHKGEKYLHLCKITEVTAEKKLAYSWRYEGYHGNSVVSFELFAEADKTRVKLTHEGLETFPQNNADFAKDSFAKGWEHIIGKGLKEFVEK